MKPHSALPTLPRASSETRSICWWSTLVWVRVFHSYTGCLKKAKEHGLPYCLPIVWRKQFDSCLSTRSIARREMQTSLSRCRTWVTCSILRYDNRYTWYASLIEYIHIYTYIYIYIYMCVCVCVCVYKRRLNSFTTKFTQHFLSLLIFVRWIRLKNLTFIIKK